MIRLASSLAVTAILLAATGIPATAESTNAPSEISIQAPTASLEFEKVDITTAPAPTPTPIVEAPVILSAPPAPQVYVPAPAPIPLPQTVTEEPKTWEEPTFIPLPELDPTSCFEEAMAMAEDGSCVPSSFWDTEEDLNLPPM